MCGGVCRGLFFIYFLLFFLLFFLRLYNQWNLSLGKKKKKKPSGACHISSSSY
jgi:hypothetical protein